MAHLPVDPKPHHSTGLCRVVLPRFVDTVTPPPVGEALAVGFEAVGFE